MLCQNCGNKLREGASFCLVCGKPVNMRNMQSSSFDMNQNPLPWQNTYQQPVKKSGGKTGRKITAVIVVIALLVGVLGFWKPGFFIRRDEPGYDDYYKYITEETGYDISSGDFEYEYTEADLELLKYLSIENDPEYIDEPVYLDDVEPYEPIEASVDGDYYVADVDEFNTVVSAGDVIVDLGAVSGEHELEVMPCYTGAEDSVAWDICLDNGQTQPDGIVAVTTHYDCDDPYDALIAYREEMTDDGEIGHIPLPTVINEEDKTITFYTDHFSVHVLQTVKDTEKLVAGKFYRNVKDVESPLAPVMFNANMLDEAAMLMDFEYDDLKNLINEKDYDDGGITGGDKAAAVTGLFGDASTVGDGIYNLGMLAKEGAGKLLGPVSVALGAVKLGILWYDKGDWRPLWKNNKIDIISLAAGTAGLAVTGSAAVGFTIAGAAIWVTSGLSSALDDWFSGDGRIRNLRNHHYDNDTQRAYMIFTRDYIAYSEAAERAGWPGGLAYHSVPSMEAYSSACYNLYKQDYYKGSRFLTCSKKIDPNMYRWRSYLMLKTSDYTNDLKTMSLKINGCFEDASEVFWKLDPSMRQGFAESIGAKNYA